MSLGDKPPMESSQGGAEVSDGASYLGYEVGSLVGFCLEVQVPRWDLLKVNCSELQRRLTVVQVEDIPPSIRSTLNKLASS